MRYSYKFSQSFPDTAQPPRHDKTVDIAVTLVFDFADINADDKRDFEARTGQKKDKFEAGFKARFEEINLERYNAALKSGAQALTTPSDWDKFLAAYVRSQIKAVENGFEEILTKISGQANKEAEKAEPVKKKLDALAALTLWLENYPVKFTVSDKFFDDHTVKSIDKNSVLDGALERYKANNTGTSSWIELGADTIKSKAAAGKKIAHVYQGAQQIGVYMSAKQWTARVSASDYKPIKDKKQPKDVYAVQKGSKVEYVEVEITKNDDYKIFVLGRWDPREGTAEVYHYEAKPPGSPTLLDKYLSWWYLPLEKRFTAPA